MEGGRGTLKSLPDHEAAPLLGNLRCQESLLKGPGGIEGLLVEKRADQPVGMRVLGWAPVLKRLQVAGLTILGPGGGGRPSAGPGRRAERSIREPPAPILEA